MVINLIKFLFTAGIIYFLIQNKLLEFSNIDSILKNPIPLIFCILIISSNTILSSIRWRFLVNNNKHKDKISKKVALKVTWIGLFFNTVLPGAITGDIVKFFYIKKEKPNLKKSYLLGTVLLDRIIGLTGLLILATSFCLFNYTELSNKSLLIKQLISGCILFSSLATFGFVTLLLPKKYQAVILNILKKIPVIHTKAYHFTDQIYHIANKRRTIIYCLALSVFIQAANVIAFWIVTSPFYETSISIEHIFVFVPVGLVTTAIPIAPAGLGVGHAAFGYLFKLINISNGASLFNLYFIAVIFNNLIGVFPYLFIKRSVREDKSEFNLIHDSIFNKKSETPKYLEQRYNDAVSKLILENKNPSKLSSQDVNWKVILQKQLDVESIEFALKRKYPQNTISQRYHILFYLAECMPEYYPDFINEKNQWIKAVTGLSYMTFRSIVKLIKGNFLIWRYKIV